HLRGRPTLSHPTGVWAGPVRCNGLLGVPSIIFKLRYKLVTFPNRAPGRDQHTWKGYFELMTSSKLDTNFGTRLNRQQHQPKHNHLQK
ncbi:MAG: hypothetical protein AAFU79_25985, partial [Myxococcota bacterium]